MRSGIRALRKTPAGIALAILALSGCLREDKIAGGSSGVDNPQVIMAFVNAEGTTVPVSGSVSVYLADQSPAVDPAPLTRKWVTGDTAVALSALDFKGDSLRAYNLLVVTGDSTGSLLRNLAYDPAAHRFLMENAQVPQRVDARLTPLVRYEAVIDHENEELLRVVVPGTPFQAVVVDSVFVIDGVPSGDTLTFHLIDSDGNEKLLKSEPPGNNGKPRHRVDPEAPPVPRPPPPEPTGPLRVNAGPDRSIVFGDEVVLLGGVEGAPADDPRLALLWRQIDADPMARAQISNPASLQPRVTFPWPGFYRFAFTAAFGNHRVTDTVLVSVQPPPPGPVFTDPNPQNVFSQTARIGAPFRVTWYAHAPDTLDVDLSRDNGETWETLFAKVPSNGPVERQWIATPPASMACMLRLRRHDGEVVAYSWGFVILNY